MNLDDLTPEQLEKVRACKTSEDFANLAKQLGCKLSDEELDSISGGGFWCGSHDCASASDSH